MLQGDRIRLRPLERTQGPDQLAVDVAAQVAIRSTPEVRSRWPGDDVAADVWAAVEMDNMQYLAIENEDGSIIGGIQWEAEEDPDHAHASIDVYLHPSAHGQGYCTDAVRTLSAYLFDEVGHHRLTMDPATDNHAAIGCYSKVGFRVVGVMRQYERGSDGTFHAGLLMELLADDFRAQRSSSG